MLEESKAETKIMEEKVEELKEELLGKNLAIQTLHDDLQQIKDEFSSCYLSKIFGSRDNLSINERYDALL